MRRDIKEISNFVLSCLVLYLKKIILSKICISHCLVLLNSGYFGLFFSIVCIYITVMSEERDVAPW